MTHSIKSAYESLDHEDEVKFEEFTLELTHVSEIEPDDIDDGP
ncbi:MAG: hypothetical protein RL333_71 [Pseudomonadota bacterium]|jgi:hypothetical protein